MSFGVLAAGCSFDASRHRSERRLFSGVTETALQPASGAVDLGSLDFFAEPEQAAAKPAAEPVADRPSETKQERRKRKKEASLATEAAASAAGPAEEADGGGGGAGGDGTAEALEMSEREVAEANALRRAMRIHVYGVHIPAPLQSAEHMAETYAFPAWLRRNVLEAGYHEMTRVQMQSVPLLANGRELLACAPTGSGKTAAFLVPMLHRLASTAPRKRVGLRGVCVAPTQELARQTKRELDKLSAGGTVSSVVLSKTLASAAVALAERDGKTPWRKYDVLVCTPLRLVSLIKKRAIGLEHVQFLVLDEADKLLELGFLEQVDEIFAACSGSNVQRALFSATMLPAVEDLARQVLRMPVRLVVGDKNAAAELVEQKLVFCGREDGKLVALRQLVREGIRPPVLIFVQSVERATQLFHELVYDGLNVDVIHADRSQAQREATVSKFREGKVWVLIATELVARGMDFKGVSLVVNYDFPQSTVSYIHRIGRTGRAGRAGRAVTFFTEADAEQLRSIANVMKASGCEVADWMLRIKPLAKDERRRRATAPVARKSIHKAPKEVISWDAPAEPADGEDGGGGGGGGGTMGRKGKTRGMEKSRKKPRREKHAE